MAPSVLISVVERDEVLELEMEVAAFLEIGLWVSKEEEKAVRSRFLEAGGAIVAGTACVAAEGGVEMIEVDLKTELGNAETASSGIINVESSE